MTLEAWLARIYVDADARARFLAAPEAEARAAGLTGAAFDAALQIDRTGLQLFAESLGHKRAKQRPPKRGFFSWLRTRAASGRSAS